MGERVIRYDDLDDSTEGVETVEFSYRNVTYEIDLGPTTTERLDAALAPFVAAARRKGRASGARPSGRSRSRATSGDAAIRATARAQGKDVPRRGPVPADVRAAFADAEETAPRA